MSPPNLPLLRRISPLATALGLAAGGALLAACPTTSSSVDITPITSIYIRAESLVAGFGCGTGPDQVFRYVAIAENTQDVPAADAGAPPDQPVLAYGAVIDCFADGVFAELAPAANGALNYHIQIYAFNKAAYDAQQPTIDAVRGLVPPGATFGQLNNAKATLAPLATYETQCEATQQVGVPVLAQCSPLTRANPSDAGAGDGGDAGDASGDAADGGNADGSPVDAADAADAAESADGDAEAGL